MIHLEVVWRGFSKERTLQLNLKKKKKNVSGNSKVNRAGERLPGREIRICRAEEGGIWKSLRKKASLSSERGGVQGFA